ncbi:PIF1-like helicase [Medicago truncatula]|uniref:ATP-dependent DNA helicase n=1 Tax=Medicago truncatula TaxID=3880 RepID=A0A072TJU2_MEDTR|nr:PIF1-like helicase [Medicago truncatula]
MLLQENGQSLTDFKSMPMPNAVDMPTFTNKLIVDELNYNKDELEKTHADMLLMLIDEQRYVHEKIMESVTTMVSFSYMVTVVRKNLYMKTLSAVVRSKRLIVLNDASSGIMTLLLPGGRTAHSTLTVPIEIMTHHRLRWKRIVLGHLVVERSMRDIMSKNDPLNEFKPFGGMTVVLGGDFKQILPVVRKGTRQDIVDAPINSSKIWAYCNVLRPTVNMRLGASSVLAEQKEIANFGKWILSIGDGNNASDENGEMKVEIPEDLLISGILAPTLDSAEHVNEYMMSLIPGEEKEYLSSDSVCRSGEILMSKASGSQRNSLMVLRALVPNHRLKLKVGCLVMLMRNIDQASGLCNEGQSLSQVGVYLPKPVFTHGQLYVAVSRVTSRKGLKLLILDENNNVCKETTNVVYREVFQKV